MSVGNSRIISSLIWVLLTWFVENIMFVMLLLPSRQRGRLGEGGEILAQKPKYLQLPK